MPTQACPIGSQLTEGVYKCQIGGSVKSTFYLITGFVYDFVSVFVPGSRSDVSNV